MYEDGNNVEEHGGDRQLIFQMNIDTVSLLDMWGRGQQNAERGETPNVSVFKSLQSQSSRVSKDFECELEFP